MPELLCLRSFCYILLISMNLNSPIYIAGVKFGNKLMNGAYIGSKSENDIATLSNSASGALLVGSISVKPRKSNPDGGYWLHKEKFYALNSFGMPNGGLPYFHAKLPEIVKLAHECSKPLLVNIVGFSSGEFIELINLAQESGADMVELNFSCPNVWEKGQQERIISYHPDMITEILRFISKRGFTIKIGVKISPLPPDILPDCVRAIVDSGVVSFVTATNSYPNAALSSGTKKAGDYKNILSGMTGRALKPISLGVVRQLHELLPKKVDIIGCGGISSANDVADYLLSGAKAVQIVTALMNEGSSIFERILYQSALI